MSDSEPIDVSQLIEGQKFGRFGVVVLLWCFGVVLCDGYDQLALAFAAPTLVKVMNFPRGALGPVFSAGLFGVMLGAIAFGYVGDRFGRKRAVIAGTLFFGVFTLATVFAASLDELLVLRFLAGLGLGGAIPNVIVIANEYAPRRYRVTFVAVMFTGFSIGAALAGPAAATLIPHFGWPGVFLVGGVVPILVSVAAVWGLPESMRFLAVTRRHDDELARLARRLAPGLAVTADTKWTAHEEAAERFTPALLFSGARRTATPVLWLVYVANSMALFFLTSWLPILIESTGLPAQQAVWISSAFQIGGALGGLFLMRFADRFGPYAIAAAALIAFPLTAAVGTPGLSEPVLLAAVTLMGLCTVGAQSAIHGTAGLFYPVAYRTNGVGWANSIGKVGAVAGPLLGGVLLSAHRPVQELFIAVSLPLFVVIVSAYALGRIYVRRFSAGEAGEAQDKLAA
jgi:AAHS family 4-hydroxybenzoate transporter-like MFS transporter